MHIDSSHYGLVTSMISIPSIFMALLTGAIADRIGVLNLLIPMISVVTLGMVI